MIGHQEKGERRDPDTLIPRYLDTKKAGFTILEAMVAVVILAIALLALLRVLPVGTRGSKLAEETTIATMLAQRKIEEVRSGTFPPSAAPKANLGSEGYSNFDYVIAVYDYVSPTTYLQGVTVSIYWPAGTEQHVIGFTTCVADYSP